MVIVLKPVIGMTAMFSDANGLRIYKINETYVKAILDAGGIPFILPSCGKEEEYVQYADKLDGYLVPGGQDVATLLYNEQPSRHVTFVRSEDDEYEFALIRKMAELNKPVLGICRGSQVINVAFGGSLYQDIPTQCPEAHGHYQKAPRYEAYHDINLVSGSRLANILGCEATRINSYHHQAVKDVAPGFHVNAKATDGIIEGIEHDEKFIIGVQWHPEGMYEVHPHFKNIFDAFIAEAAKNK